MAAEILQVDGAIGVVVDTVFARSPQQRPELVEHGLRDAPIALVVRVEAVILAFVVQLVRIRVVQEDRVEIDEVHAVSGAQRVPDLVFECVPEAHDSIRGSAQRID